MNRPTNRPTDAHAKRLEDALGRKIAAHLGDTTNLNYTAKERLRAARTQALSAANLNPTALTQHHNDGTAALNIRSVFDPILFGLIALLAIGLLIFGARTLSQSSQHQHITRLAAVDTELLSNDLPLSAYTDPGFQQFLANQQVAAHTPQR